MTDSYWSGLGVAAGTTITTGNVNNAGNSDAAAHSHTVTYSVSGSPTTAVFAQQPSPVGPGLSITAGAAVISRLDLAQVTANGGACQIIYTPSGTPTTADSVIAVARNSGANMAHAFHVVATNTIAFRDTNGTSAVTGGTSPALTAGHSYQVDMVVALNAGTPSTSNGRLIGRVRDLSDATWNTVGEFFVDTGYTINIGTTQNTQWRVAKVTSASVQPQTYYTGIRWGERTVDTSTDPTIARQQFIAVGATPHLLVPAVRRYHHMIVR